MRKHEHEHIFFLPHSIHICWSTEIFIQTYVIIMEVLFALCWQTRTRYFLIFFFAYHCYCCCCHHHHALFLLFRISTKWRIEARARCCKQFMLAIAHRSTTNESLIVLDFADFLCVFFIHCERTAFVRFIIKWALHSFSSPFCATLFFPLRVYPFASQCCSFSSA